MLPQQGYTQQPVYAQQPVMYAQQPQVLVVQQQPTHGKPLSGMERLDNKDGIFIKQKIDVPEMFCMFERENSYSIFNMDKGAQKTGVELLRAREKSNCCTRQICSGKCRPFVMNVQLRDNDEKVHNQPFLEIERPCTCSCLCFARPTVNVHHVENGKRTYLGKLVNDWQCNCDLNMEVYDSTNNLQFKIKGACCSKAVLCDKCPCQPCQTLDFMVTTAGGLVVSTIQKKTAGCCASAHSLADNYAVTFPGNSTVETKALMMTAALFIDYLWFEKGGMFCQLNCLMA